VCTHVLLFFPISLNICSRDRIFVLRSVYVSRFFVHTSKDDYDVRRDFAASPAVRVRIETRSFTFNRLIIGRKREISRLLQEEEEEEEEGKERGIFRPRAGSFFENFFARSRIGARQRQRERQRKRETESLSIYCLIKN
jgi:hypothetical protein